MPRYLGPLPRRLREPLLRRYWQAIRYWRWMRGQIGPLPDFAVIGASKCGTTSLYASIMSHPGAVPAIAKELHYFSVASRPSLDFYRTNFWDAVGPPRRVTGEATPNYLNSLQAPIAMREAVPNIRLIVLLRNPAMRALSLAHMLRRRGNLQEPVEDLLNREIDAVGQIDMNDLPAIMAARWHDSPIRTSLYAIHIENWFAHYPRESFLFLHSERFFGAPAAALADVDRFLGLSPRAAYPSIHANRGGYPAPSAALVERLRAFYQEPNRHLRALLGPDFDFNSDDAALQPKKEGAARHPR